MTTKSLNVNLNFEKTPKLAIDGQIIENNEHTLTINFLQALLDPAQQQVVARVTMTRTQAKDFLKSLNEHIGKFEV